MADVSRHLTHNHVQLYYQNHYHIITITFLLINNKNNGQDKWLCYVGQWGPTEVCAPYV